MTENKSEFLTKIYNVLEEVSEDLTIIGEIELSDELFEVMFKIGTKLDYYTTSEE